MRAHAAARKAIKEIKPEIKVGVSFSMHDIQWVDGGEERAKKEWDDEFSHYLPWILEDDFIGVQNYTRSIYDANGSLPAPDGAKTTQMGYENYPEALEHVIGKCEGSDFLISCPSFSLLQYSEFGTFSLDNY